MNLIKLIPLKLTDLRSYCVHVCKQTFLFTGGEIVNEFLMSTGYLPGAHSEDCPVFARVAEQSPLWMET
jgi:DNA-3-methyladenine glycosylase I